MPRPVALIAELCQNHNGRFELVERMVESAAEAGATHIKLQTIYANTLAFRPQFEEGLTQDGRVRAIKRPYQPEYQRLKGLELTPDQCARFVEVCRAARVVPVTTCFARIHVASIAQQGFETIKVASYDCASYPMLRDLAGKFRELIVSTGATFDDEIRHAANSLRGTSFSLLHCVTLYPTPLDQMHLARMEWLRELAPRVGFSDHSLVARDGIIAAKAALALGAELVERHFTVLAADESKDGPVSITPEQLKELAVFAKLELPERVARLDSERPDWRVMLGERQRALSDAELLNRDYYRGRFASPRPGAEPGTRMIYNWEETPLP
jgi:N,N'-diacetyllegionaminate synthase